MGNIPFARRFAGRGDELLGYHKPKSKWKWWFDFEVDEDVFKVPTDDKKK